METRLPEVEELCASWITHLEGSGKSPSTIQIYRGCINEFVRFLRQHEESWDSLTPKFLDAFKVHLLRVKRVAASSVNLHLAALRGFYRWLKWSRYIEGSLALDVRCVKRPRLLPKPFSEEQVMAIIDAAKDDLEMLAMIEVMYSTGCRISELQGMNLQDVDLARGQILTMGKGSQERYLELGKPAMNALKLHLLTLEGQPGDSPVWLGNGGKRVKLDTIRKRLRAIAAKAGIVGRIHPHRFRHSFATHLLDHGADIRKVQELLGHLHLTTTQIYTQVSRAQMKKTHLECHPRA